jgi:hypothetical protein
MLPPDGWTTTSKATTEVSCRYNHRILSVSDGMQHIRCLIRVTVSNAWSILVFSIQVQEDYNATGSNVNGEELASPRSTNRLCNTSNLSLRLTSCTAKLVSDCQLHTTRETSVLHPLQTFGCS